MRVSFLARQASEEIGERTWVRKDASLRTETGERRADDEVELDTLCPALVLERNGSLSTWIASRVRIKGHAL